MSKRRVEIIKETQIFERFFFKIIEAELRHELYSGKMSSPLTRLSFVRGDSIAILMHDPDADTVVLTEQFRYPTYRPPAASSASPDLNDGWLLEIPAGTVEPGELPEATVRREVREEIGYRVREARHLSTFYLSPGGTSERILLYYASVHPEDQTAKGGGLVAEGEDIRVMLVKVDEALAKVHRGEIHDAKSIIALQWLELHRQELRPRSGQT